MAERRILFVYYKLFKPGGVAKVLSTLANELTAEGYRVEILLLMSERPHFYELDPRIRVHCVDTFSHWAWKVCVLNKKLFRHFSKINNLNSYIYHIGVYLLLKQWMNKHQQNYDTIISCWYKLSCFLAMNKKTASKTIAWEHADYNAAGRIFGILRNFYKNLKKVVTINSSGLKFYPQFAKTVLIPNIIGEPFESNTFQAEKENLISFVGRLDKEKNVNELIEIFADANLPPDWKLQIIGDGPKRRNLEALVEKMGVKNNVIFHGFKNPEEINRLLLKSKIFGFASLKEALPLVLVEAMFASNALVAYDCNYGPADIINENNGFLIPVRDLKSFTAKIEILVHNKKQLFELTKKSYIESGKWKKSLILTKWKTIL